MTHLQRAVAAMAIALSWTIPATAQTRPVSLTPADAPRWDVAGHVGWLGLNGDGAAPTWNSGWFDAGSVGANAGYYWTQHLKLEADLATSSSARFYTAEPLVAAGRQVFRSREHAVTVTSAGTSLAYQFFENRWVHPFLAAGLEVARERDRVESFLPPVIGPDGRAPVPAPSLETNTAYVVRPMLSGGFKVYMGERAFLKTEVRSTVDGGGAATFSWRGGIGVDF